MLRMFASRVFLRSSQRKPSAIVSTSPASTAEFPAKPSNFVRFLGYVAPYKWYVVAGAVGGIVKFGVPLLMPEVSRHLIDDVYLNSAMSRAQKQHELLFYVGGMAAIFIFFWAPLVYIRHYYAGKAGHQSVFDLRRDLYYRILRMSPSFFDHNKSGSIVSRMISDIELAQNLVGAALTNVWMDLASLVFILFFLLRIDFQTTLVALVTFPLYIYLYRRLQDQIRTTSHQVQQEISHISGNIQEKVSGSRVVHAFTQEKNEERHFYQESTRLLSTTMRRVYYQSVNMTVTGVIVQLAPLIVMIYGGHRVINGTLSVGDLVAVSMYLSPLYTPLQRFSELNIVYSNAMAALDRVFEVMDAEPEIRDKVGAITLPDITGRVTFEEVCFAYHHSVELDHTAEERARIEERGPVLERVSFQVQAGQKIALVGPSGSGKSTVVSLIPRFYDVDSGRVLIDDYDVRDITIRSLRQQIGMVLQNPILFSGSISDNIRYGRPEASKEEIIQAAKDANAYDFIMQMPHGFDTEVGEMGAFLSGGQKQRITIARAFLKNPRILILDEATSALDSESEKLVQAALERLMEGRTTFIIAHRLSTIENADRIMVLQHGHLVESGTHAELLHAGGLYEQLYRSH